MVVWCMVPSKSESLCRLTHVAPLDLATRRRTGMARCCQTRERRARVNVQKCLHCSHKECPKQRFTWPTEVLGQIQSNQFCIGPSSFRAVVHNNFCNHCGVARTSRIPTSVVCFWNRRPWAVALVVEFAALVPLQYVTMQRQPRLSFCAIPISSAHTQGRLLVAGQEILFYRVCAPLK